MVKIAFLFVIALVVIVFHYWACRRPPKYWYMGGIVPVAWGILLAVCFFSGRINWTEDWKIVLFPTLLVFLMWGKATRLPRKKKSSR